MEEKDLLALGLSGEHAKLVLEEMEKQQIIPYSRFKAVNDAKNDLEQQIKNFSGQLETLKSEAENGSELELKIQELQNEQENLKTEYENKLTNSIRESELRFELLKDNDVRDVDILISLLDKGSISYDENNKISSGLKEQKELFKESKPFLFIDNEPPTQPSIFGAKPSNIENGKPAPSVSTGAQIAQQLNGAKQQKTNDPWG